VTSSDDLERRALELLEALLDLPAAERAEALARSGAPADAVARARELLEREASEAEVAVTGAGLATMAAAEADAPAPERVGSYRIVRLIGRGGMGAVYLGERDAGDFEHRAAVKIVRGAALDAKRADRLRAERQVVAGLQHPNIAQLFDGGELEGGAPYFIMEHVDGASLKAAAPGLSLDDRLAVLRAVCDAVSYAHRNLVAHGDLTPSNVLVSSDGAAKVIDFGVSRSFGSGSPGATSSGLTRAYASPERIAGAPPTPSADIYSLGVLLSELIEGIRPPRVGDLTAIANKACADDPEERYAGVDLLAADLEAYRDGRPVSAAEGGAGYRLRRLVGRRPFAAAATAIVSLATVAAAGVTTALYLEADRAEAEATRRFEDVRALARTLMTDVYAEVYRVPGATRARRVIVEAAQDYYEGLASDPRADADVAREAAEGFSELGRIAGGAKIGEAGDVEAAEAHFDRARTILLDLEARRPDDVAVLRALGRLYFNMAEISENPKGDNALAIEQLEASETFLRRAAGLAGGDVDIARTLLHSTSAKAVPLARLDRGDEARAILRDTIAEGRTLLTRNPLDAELLRLISANGRSLGLSLTLDGRLQDAVAVLDQAIADVAAAKPLLDDDAYILRDEAVAHWRRAYALHRLGRDAEALADYDRAIALTDERIARDPFDEDAKSLRVIFVAEKATPLAILGRMEEAEAALRAGLAWHQERYDEEPDLPARQRAVYVQHYLLATHYAAAGDETARCASFADMMAMKEKMEALGTLQPSDAALWPEVAAEHPNCGG